MSPRLRYVLSWVIPILIAVTFWAVTYLVTPEGTFKVFDPLWWWLLVQAIILSALIWLEIVRFWNLRDERRKRRVILVDMDGVLANWDAAWDASVLALGDRGKGILLSHERRIFNLFHGLDDEQKAIVTEIVERPGFYADLPIIDGAKQALRQMLKAGYDVRIVTSPWNSNPTCASDKLAWVIKNLGWEWGQRLIITNDKTLVRGDWLIDDKPEVKGSQVPTWEHIWFTQPINMHLTGKRRINYWTSWREVIGYGIAA